MLNIGTEVVSTWSPNVRGVIVGYGYLFMNGRPNVDQSDSIREGMSQVYLVDIGRGRMFDLDREPPGPTAARILSLRLDRVRAVVAE